ncbi:hypothetical protein BGV68_01915 [Burkholderia ubonensis]|uniref:hypothetical protein n=1 Tax=Burkholderia ubonensis TaxID=101571 RepID=UPI0008FDA4B9|nr:hypothetical protein [Burkholderia ubonensis]OJA63802.1 hypothetical protein BGV68_01915 [Burkholderia ubonensis]
MQFALDLKAGQAQRHLVGGNLFLMVTNGGATDIEVTIEKQGRATNVFSGVPRGFKFRAPEGFTSISFLTAEDAHIEFIITSGDVDTNLVDGATVNVGSMPPIVIANPATQPVPVAEQNWPHALRDGLAIVNEKAVPLTGVPSLVVTPPAGAKAIRLRNVGKEVIALGGPGLTAANAVIVLNPGAIREETDANLAPIWGVSDNAKGVGESIVNVEVVTT